MDGLVHRNANVLIRLFLELEMKDPLQKEPTAYDILGISRNATMDEIKRAFGQALQEKKYAPQQIAEAHKRLLNVETRLEEDFFYYEKEKALRPDLNEVHPLKFKDVTHQFEDLMLYDEIDKEMEIERWKK